MSGTHPDRLPRPRSAAVARVLAAVFLGALPWASASPASAAVTFTDWSDRPFEEVVLEAAEARRLVLLVVTQPDWCPPCIRLDREVLTNPEETRLAGVAGDWVALEVLGYDEPGATLLRRQGVAFVGTPSSFLIALEPGQARLRDGTLLTAIAGYPPDYVDRLVLAAEGQDGLAEAMASAEKEGRPTDWIAVGRLQAERGRAELAREAYGQVLTMRAADLTGISVDSLATVQELAEWELITRVTDRVERDYEAVQVQLHTFAAVHPEFAATESFHWEDAWSLAALGRGEEAMDVMERHFLSAKTADGLLSFLYLAFRKPTPVLLERAEMEVQAGLEAYPEDEGALSAAYGRILRRMEREDEAVTWFQRAVEVTDPESSSYVVYLGQLEYLEQTP